MGIEICLLVYLTLILLLLVFRKKSVSPSPYSLAVWWNQRDGVLCDLSVYKTHGQLGNPDEWHYIARVFYGTGDFIYVDGELQELRK